MADKIAPYPNDIAYVTDEIAHVKARARRIGIKNRIEEIEGDPVPFRGTIGKGAPAEPLELRRVLALAEQEEQAVRGDIDQRLAVNRATGPVLGLDGLCSEFGLTAFDRAVLVLATMSAMGADIAAAIDPACGRGMCGTWTCAETVWQYLELDVEGRVMTRINLQPTSPLLRCGLITLDLGRSASPQHLCDARIEITNRAFSRIVGMPSLAHEDPEEQ